MQPRSQVIACVKLTEDDDVFAVVGYLQDDAVLCPMADHATATIGGLTTEAGHANHHCGRIP